MGRAHRGIFAGRHIQFGNRVSEDGGNKGGEGEAKFERQFKEVKLEERAARREFRRKLYGWPAGKLDATEDAEANDAHYH